MDAHYFCPPCKVWGYGSTCWCCGEAGELVTSGPKVDGHVYDWPPQESAHTMTHTKP